MEFAIHKSESLEYLSMETHKISHRVWDTSLIFILALVLALDPNLRKFKRQFLANR